MKIVIIGAGNVGFHLGKALSLVKNIEILQVFSRTKAKAQRSAQNIGCSFTTKINKINSNGDLYIFAVNDSAIAAVAEALSLIDGLPHKLVVHTSGATPSTIFSPYFKRFGIFYPLQTFSISKQPDFWNIPFCIDAQNEKDARELSTLAKKISSNVEFITDEKRAILHVAAVFVNNFTNYMYTIGEEILDKENIPFDLLKPLIIETAEKIKNNPAKKMQTGPAVREDFKTIEKHIRYLQKSPSYCNLYDILTKAIQNKTE